MLSLLTQHFLSREHKLDTRDCGILARYPILPVLVCVLQLVPYSAIGR